MSRETIETAGHDSPHPGVFGSAVRAFTLAGATFTTGLIAGVLYAYAVSVNLGLAAQPDASYIATMQAINEKIQNPLFFLSFFGAALFSLAALAAHFPRPRPGPRSGPLLARGFGLCALHRGRLLADGLHKCAAERGACSRRH